MTRRYIVHHPAIAPCIVWADCETAAFAAVSDYTGLNMHGAHAEPYVSPFGEIDAHETDRSTVLLPITDEE